MHIDSLVQLGAQPIPSSKKMVWTGRILSGLIVTMLTMDGVMKLVKPAPVIEATAKLGYPDSTTVGIGVLLLACTLLYSLRKTAVLGAILLTAYLGGATATHVRVGSEPFSVFFPAILGLMIWGGLYFRDARLRAILPFRS